MTVEPRDPFDLCGVTIDGKYRVASVIGDGGFGVVYRGVHKGFGELIAIKCLKLPTALDEAARAELLEKLQDEGRLLHRLSKATSGIVQALDVGAFTTPSGVWVPYLVMEWLEGETLGEFLKRRDLDGEGGMDLEDAVRLLEPAARALAVAHAQKIAHRDVKPANIFITEVGGRKTAKVLDFGIAKVLSDHRGYTTALENTAMAPTAFTPRYGAPEQFNKQRGATGPWTDVFALALVLVECVSGRKALQGDDPTQLYIASADPALRPTLRARGVEVDEVVEEVLRKALEVEPKNRFADAGSFWSALSSVANVGGSETYPQIALTRSSRPGSPTSSPPKPSSGRAGSKPKIDLSDEPMLETSEYAARRQLRSNAEGEPSDARSAFNPTIPVESLKARNDKPAPKKRSRDAMEETPEGARFSTKASARANVNETTVLPPSKGSYIWAALAVAVFAGGAIFVYSTLTATPETKRKVGSASASASNSAPKTTPPKPILSVSASATATASEVPTATVEPTASVTASASVSASAEPVTNEHDDMIKIDGATLAVGDPGVDTVIKPFFMDRVEVNARKYQACVNAGKCTAADAPVDADPADVERWKARCNSKRADADHPMNCVSYSQAEAYCRWQKKRLPTEAEWELAARSPNGNKYPWGDSDPTCARGCFDLNLTCRIAGKDIETCVVGTSSEDKTDALVYDLAGNVSEWVKTDTPERVAKGGNFFLGTDAVIATGRTVFPAGYAHPTIGFRCVSD